MKQIALVAGATGLVGGHLVRRLLGNEGGKVVAVSRRPLGFDHPRLSLVQADLGQLDTMEPVPGAGVAYSALGTTMKVAGSEAAFRAVDHDAVLSFARLALRSGARTFVHVSSVGAKATSGNFYLRVKAEVEEAIANLPFSRVVALRPGLLLGSRAGSRPAEAVARAVMPLLNPLLVGRLRNLRAIDAGTVAAAMIAAARGTEPGRFVWEYDVLKAQSATVRPA